MDIINKVRDTTQILEFWETTLVISTSRTKAEEILEDALSPTLISSSLQDSATARQRELLH
jgi:hypothetical protein